jgi:ABC-type transport system involved in cytochrome bd biosynthesis fused ATPase/permease subunit
MERFRTIHEKRKMVKSRNKIKPFYLLLVFYAIISMIAVVVRVFDVSLIAFALALILLFFVAILFFLIFKADSFYEKVYHHENSDNKDV